MNKKNGNEKEGRQLLNHLRRLGLDFLDRLPGVWSALKGQRDLLRRFWRWWSRRTSNLPDSWFAPKPEPLPIAPVGKEIHSLTANVRERDVEGSYARELQRIKEHTKQRKAFHDELSKIIIRVFYALVGTSLFCVVTLAGAAETQVLSPEAKVKLPGLNYDMGFEAFLVVGPIILIALSVYLHIFTGQHRRLVVDEENIQPILPNFRGQTPRLAVYVIFYWMVPITLAVFAWKAWPRPIGPLLGILAGLVTASLVLLQMRRSPLEWRPWALPLLASALLLYCTAVYWTITSRTMDLFNADLSGKDLRNHRLPGAKLSEAKLSEANLTDADLSGANLAGADLSKANLTGAKLTGSDLTKADLTEAKLIEADLAGAFLTGAKLCHADLWEADLSNADLSNANLTEAKLTFEITGEDKVIRANLSGTKLLGAKLIRANLHEAKLFQVDLSDAELIDANLSGAELFETDLSGVNLSKADLSWAALPNADLSQAYMIGADLSQADLSDANLFKANLTGANLSDAVLSGVSLSEAILSGADLSDAEVDQDALNRACGDGTILPEKLTIEPCPKSEGVESENTQESKGAQESAKPQESTETQAQESAHICEPVAE